ncbi:hypothetical protein BaRGS_00038032 [Batillaria attramentaria]|uniref:Uncharacterized protein n=1 Tax=Batillaria attramentaria TaxID=370345 RepID=A0ABD0J7C8_9CAEN
MKEREKQKKNGKSRAESPRKRPRHSTKESVESLFTLNKRADILPHTKPNLNLRLLRNNLLITFRITESESDPTAATNDRFKQPHRFHPLPTGPGPPVPPSDRGRWGSANDSLTPAGNPIASLAC